MKNIITKILTKIILTWLASSLVLVGISASLLLANVPVRSYLEHMTSIIAVLSIIFSGAIISYLMFRIDQTVALINASSYSTLLLCYLSYVLYDIGKIYNHIYSINFNFATTVVSISSVLVAYIAYNLHKGHSKDDKKRRKSKKVI